MLIAFSSAPARILIVKPSAIGDVVHTLPVLNLLRKTFPDAEISWLATPAVAGILEGHPQLDRVILFDRKALSRGWWRPGGYARIRSLLQSLRRPGFDLVIDLQGLFRSGLLTRITGAPNRVGFAAARELAPMFYTDRVEVGSPEQHALERYLTLAESVGCGRSPVEFQFPTDDADRVAVDAMLPDAGGYVVLLPSTNWPTKRWPAEYFAELVGPLYSRFGLTSVVAGGPDALEAARLMPNAINLVGKTSLRQLVALFERAALVIANDTGPMHIAAALGRPLVTPYGPTNPVRTGPFGRMDTVARVDIPCSPCYSRTCSHQSCMKWLKVEAVLKLAEAQLGK
jgi:lipopolysaccharide heptosyltransferase I